MIHHVSIPAHDPRQVAEVLAELMEGRAYPFSGPLPGAYMAVSGDPHGTMIEVYQEDVTLLPGDGDLQVVFNRGASAYQSGPVHILLSVPRSKDEIQAIGDRVGWRTRYFGRGRPGQPAVFHLFELWVENRFMVEVAPCGVASEYEKFMQFETLDALFAR
jgi:hypothetical protein